MSSFLTTNFVTNGSTGTNPPTNNKDLGNFFQLNLPVGTVLPFAGNVLPPNFLWCDDQTYSRTTYNKLYDVIGTVYGDGDGSNTFNVPNLTRKFPIGASNKDNRTIRVLINNTLDDKVTGGNSIMQQNQLAAHTHDPPTSNSVSIRGYAVYNNLDVQDNIQTGSNGIFINSNPSSYNIQTTGSVTSLISTSDFFQPFTVLNYIIKFN
jgi:microcystin-dependent protein